MKKLAVIFGLLLTPLAVFAGMDNVYVLNPVRISTTANAVSISASTIGVTDAGGSLTVDNAGTFAVQAAQSGSWAITGSTVGVTDSGGSITVDFSSATAKAEVFASINSSVLYSSNTYAMIAKFAAIAGATAGQNVIVSTVTARKIRVIRYGLVCGAATNVYWTSGSGTVIYGGSTNKMNFAANGGISEPYCPVGIMETASDASLELNMSSTGPCSGGVTYVEVP